MVFGMSLATYTIIHVIISLVAIVAGLISLVAMVGNRPLGVWNTIFLWTTIATSVTGFGFPNDHLTPGIIIGILSMIVLAVAVFALYARHVTGAWRWIYVLTASIALWFNVFVLIVQSFQKIDVLKALAPTQSEPPFQAAQAVALVIVALLAIMSLRRFRPLAT